MNEQPAMPAPPSERSEPAASSEQASGTQEARSVGSSGPPVQLPVADGGLMLIGVGEALGRLVGTVRPADNIHILRIQSVRESADVFSMACPPPAEMLDICPFLEDLGLNTETFSLDLRCCTKALYLVHRAALLDRLRRTISASPTATFVLVAEAASSLGATLLSELPADLEQMFARRYGKLPCIVRVPIFPVTSGEELERTTLYALAKELDGHYRGIPGDGPEPVCENPHDVLVLSDFQVGTPSQRRDEVVRFLGSLAAFFRNPGSLAARDNPIVQHKLNGPWRRPYRDLIALWKGGSWADFRRWRMIKELETEGRPPPLVDQEPFRAGRRLYLEMDVRYRRLLSATSYDYPGRISPDDAGSYGELGEQLLDQGRDRDAFDAFLAATEARADMPEAFEGMGRAALLLGDHEEAMKDFTRAVQLDPDRQASHEGIILCYLMSGRPDQARKHYELATATGCKIDSELVKRLQ